MQDDTTRNAAHAGDPLRDACGLQCHHVTLPDLFDTRAAAELFIAPGRCVILDALPDVQWTVDGVRTFAFRVAGRVPLVWDSLPPALGDLLAREVLQVLDWTRTGAA